MATIDVASVTVRVGTATRAHNAALVAAQAASLARCAGAVQGAGAALARAGVSESPPTPAASTSGSRRARPKRAPSWALKRKRALAVGRQFPTTTSGRATARSVNLDAQLAALEEGMEAVASGRGRYLSAAEQSMVVHAHMAELKARVERRKKKKQRAGQHTDNALDVTARRMGVGRATVQKLWADYKAGRLLTDYEAPGSSAGGAKTKADQSRIRADQEVVDMVREFVRTKHREHRAVTGRDVTMFLIDKGELGTVDLMNKKQFDAAHRCVRRWLQHHGWMHGRKKGKVKMMETPKLRSQRAQYLATMKANREGEKLREVFTDESYVHQHYHHDDRTLYDPADKQDIAQKKHRFKGDRYNMIGCILGPDLTKPEAEREDTFADKGGWYAPAYAKFHAPLRRKKDYHACFDSKWYNNWFEKVCKSLQQDGYRCLFSMDNVSYHNSTRLNELKHLKKADLFQQLKAGSVAAGFDPTFWDQFPTKVSLVQYLESVDDLVDTTVVTIAATYGHKVAYTPPYHSDLQPIEVVWAIVKQQVAAKYHIDVTMDEVLANMDEAFASLSPTTVYGCYKRALVHEAKAQKLVDEDEAQGDDDDTIILATLACNSTRNTTIAIPFAPTTPTVATTTVATITTISDYRNGCGNDDDADA